MKIVDRETTARLADAATLLLDAAREATKHSASYRPGQPNTKDTLALAVQALLFADHYPHNGPTLGALPAGFHDRWLGAAAGLGASIGMVKDRNYQLVALMSATNDMAEAAHQAAKMTAGFKP
jgi:hypothetical protein